MGRLVNISRGVAVLCVALGVGLAVVGLPATVLLGLEPRSEFAVRFLVSGALYVLAGLLLHPATWERTPFSYPAIRAPMMAFLPFAAATAVWN